MTITEAARHQLHQALIASLGEQEAATLMEHLPPIGWADVSTKADLDHLRVATSADIENLRVATSADIENLRVATHADFAALGEKVDRSAAEIRAEVAIQLKESQRWTVTAMLSSTALLGTVLGVLIAVT